MSDDLETVLTVEPGACRFRTRIQAHMDEDRVTHLNLESDCPYVRKVGEEICSLTLDEIIQMPFCENKVYRVSGRLLKHSVCPVPMAMLKCAEAAAGLALKKDIKAEYKR